jgi:hypothetical protein
MARVGFRKTFAAETFDKAGVQQLFELIRTCLIDAQYQVLLNTAEGIDIMPLGVDTSVANDDIPHWALTFLDVGSTAYIRAIPVYGLNYLDPAARVQNNIMIVNPNWLNSPVPEITFWFAADGVAGWWWLHGRATSPWTQNGWDMSYCTAGVTTRRYPADTHQGLSTRYGLWDDWGDFYPAYALNEDGTLNQWPWTGTWSPMGEGWTFNGKRHPSSPLAKMAVPQFPNRDGGAFCLYGEFNEILAITDGYAQEDIVVPGWVAMTGSEWDQPYAVPAPEVFVDPDAPPP